MVKLFVRSPARVPFAVTRSTGRFVPDGRAAGCSALPRVRPCSTDNPRDHSLAELPTPEGYPPGGFGLGGSLAPGQTVGDHLDWPKKAELHARVVALVTSSRVESAGGDIRGVVSSTSSEGTGAHRCGGPHPDHVGRGTPWPLPDASSSRRAGTQ